MEQDKRVANPTEERSRKGYEPPFIFNLKKMVIENSLGEVVITINQHHPMYCLEKDRIAFGRKIIRFLNEKEGEQYIELNFLTDKNN